MAAPDPFKPMSSATQILRAPQEFGFEADFADLAARFAAKSGGGLSPELSAELALEIVLNEIVEQACQVTGATGAAIVLERDGELICRASSGSTAPELGSHVDKATGLSGECVRTRRTQWCDDTLTDPRAEGEPSKHSGARAMVVMPLLRNDVLVGIFELFSIQPYAFGVRDERALETLADRTVTNLDHAAHPPEAEGEPGPAADLQQDDLQKIGLQDVDLQTFASHGFGLPALEPDQANPAQPATQAVASPEADSTISDLPDLDFSSIDILKLAGYPADGQSGDKQEPHSDEIEPASMTPEDIHALLENAGVIASDTPPAMPDEKPALQLQAAPARPPEQHVDYVSWALGFAIVSVAVLLGLVLGQHFVLSHPNSPSRTVASNPAAPATQKTPIPETTGTAATPNAEVQKPEMSAKSPRPNRNSIAHHSAANSDEAVPPGGLVVSQDGKEVFRLPPSNNLNSPAASQPMQPASQVEEDAGPQSQRVVELPEATAQRELLHRVEPDYPETALQQKIQGAVVLEVHIGTDGGVEDVEVVSGPPLLAQASIAAVKQWKFKPQIVNGQPTEMQTRVTLNFKLPQ